MKDIPFDKNFGKWFANDVLRAIRRFDLISENEKISVALSGGKDSTTLLYILAYLKKYSDLTFSLSAVHIKLADYDTSSLKDFCKELHVDYFESALDFDHRDVIENCYICSRLKRGALSALLSTKKIFKIAYGHHATDVAETFLMNIINNKKLGALTPKVEIPESTMTIIRPMIYLEERTIKKLHAYFDLPDFDIPCPFRTKTERDSYKELLQEIDRVLLCRGFARIIVQTLEASNLKDWTK